MRQAIRGFERRSLIFQEEKISLQEQLADAARNSGLNHEEIRKITRDKKIHKNINYMGFFATMSYFIYVIFTGEQSIALPIASFQQEEINANSASSFLPPDSLMTHSSVQVRSDDHFSIQAMAFFNNQCPSTELPVSTEKKKKKERHSKEKKLNNPDLLLASEKGDIQRISKLLENNANVDLQNNIGVSALMAAAIKGHDEIGSLLLEYNADVDLRSNDGVSALMAAAQDGHESVVSMLLKHNADVNLQNNDGFTALQYAEHLGFPSIVKMIQEHHAANQGASMLSP